MAGLSPEHFRSRSPEDLSAPQGSFKLVISVVEQFSAYLGDERSSRRVVCVTPVSPQELNPKGIRHHYYPFGQPDLLETIREAQPLLGEQFAIARVVDDPFLLPYEEFVQEGEPIPVEYTFAISNRGRVIGLKAVNPHNPFRGLVPPPFEQILDVIRAAIQDQARLPSPHTSPKG